MKKKQVTIIVLVISFLAVIMVLSTLLNKKPNVTLQVAPSKAKIVINGKEVDGESLHLSPGGYKLTASFDGFIENTQSFNVKEGEVTELIVLLNPANEEGDQYLRDNPEEQFKRESLGGLLSKKLSAQLTEQNPILESLPFIDNLFRVDYGASEKATDPSAVALYVTYYTPQGKQEADDWLKYKGVDLTTAEVNYIDGSDSL